MATKHSLETVLDAIRGRGKFMSSDGKISSSGGNITTVARRLDVSRETVYSYKSRWKTVENALADEKEAMLDFTENQLYNLIAQGNVAAIIFTLKTQGKKRGYVERQEFTGADMEPIEFVITKYEKED